MTIMSLLSNLGDDHPLFDPKQEGTEALHALNYRAAQLAEAYLFLVQKFVWLEEKSLSVAKVLAKISAEKTEPSILESIKRGEVGHMREFLRRAPVYDQLLFTGVVDAFESYLSDLLQGIYLTKPAMLRSSDKVTLDNVLRHRSMESLISTLAQRKALELSYLSFPERHDAIWRQTGFTLIEDENLRTTVARCILIRNTVVHARGVIDERTAKALGDASLAGKSFTVDQAVALDLAALVSVITRDVDARAIEKFGLASIAFRPPARNDTNLRDITGLPEITKPHPTAADS